MDKPRRFRGLVVRHDHICAIHVCQQNVDNGSTRVTLAALSNVAVSHLGHCCCKVTANQSRALLNVVRAATPGRSGARRAELPCLARSFRLAKSVDRIQMGLQGDTLRGVGDEVRRLRCRVRRSACWQVSAACRTASLTVPLGITAAAAWQRLAWADTACVGDGCGPCIGS